MKPDWLQLDAHHCWHPYTQHALDPEPMAVTGAHGAWLELADGRRVLDAISSWWTCLHGHCHPRLLRAMAEQAARLDHVIYAGCAHEPAARLAGALAGLAPRGLSRVFYSDDGSTAVEVALKAAYLAWARRGEARRSVFLALEGGYHGDTFGAMSAGDPQPFFRELSPFLFHVARVPADAAALEQALAAQDGRVAALILEPLVQGAAGMKMHAPQFLRDARRLCDARGVFLIADEVMTGFGRTGSLFACEQAGIAPDLLCLAKGLTGGTLPLAVTLAREEIYAAFLGPDRGRALFHGHSYTANPIACAVALESLRVLDEERTPQRLEQIGGWIENGLEGLRSAAGVREIRRCGGIVAVELDGAGGYLAPLGEHLRAACRGFDVLLRPLGNVLYALPPSCTTREECAFVAAAMTAACEKALGQGRGA
ncbi:MAG: adenosylmethionine--8-amino-7-oxononanoate transaminase [Planctomycetota bacterium]|nr:MAG: adenosylmethionine--8-amino-7-oxononanoate transaminase [Planctomycetota bacterium]